MFYYLEGVVSIIENNIAVLDIGGVGYCCNTTLNTISHLETGKKARLYTYCNVKEDAFDIFGFYDLSEKRSFEMLLSVSGVGPKAAIAILSSVTPGDLALGIISENEKVLTSAPGIGKRLAQRIILELKDKIAKENKGLTFSAGDSAGFATGSITGTKINDVSAALAVLGYTPAEINAALRGIDIENLPIEDIIKQVLKNSVK